MAKRIGIDCKLYTCLTGGVFNAFNGSSNAPGSASLTLVSTVKDVSWSMSRGSADKTTRAAASEGIRYTEPTLGDLTLELTFLDDEDDAHLDLLKVAMVDRSEVPYAAMNHLEASAGSDGVTANFKIHDFSRAEPIDDMAAVTVTLRPSSFFDYYTSS